jgi:hypothetical protein
VIVVPVLKASAAAVLALVACRGLAAPLTAQMRVTASVVPACSQLATARDGRNAAAFPADLVSIRCSQGVAYTLRVLRPQAPAASAHSAAVGPLSAADPAQATIVQIDF